MSKRHQYFLLNLSEQKIPTLPAMSELTPPQRTGIAAGLALLALAIGAVDTLTFTAIAALAEPTIASKTSNVSLLDRHGQSRLAPQLLAQQQQPRTALVIGNADYGGEDSLEGPINDAQAIYEKLLELGFDVPPPLLNATK